MHEPHDRTKQQLTHHEESLSIGQFDLSGAYQALIQGYIRQAEAIEPVTTDTLEENAHAS